MKQDNNEKDPLIQFLQVGLYGFSYPYTNSNIKIAQSRVDLHEESGELEKSLNWIRRKHKFKLLDWKDDMNLEIDCADITAITASSWYNSLTEIEEQKLITDIFNELYRMEIPVMAAENYIESALYGAKLVVPMFPMQLFYLITMLPPWYELKLSTADKKWVKMLYKKYYNLPQKGAIPKAERERWNHFKKFVLNAKPQRVRRFKATEMKKATLKEKGVVIDKNFGDGHGRPYRLTDADIAGAVFDFESSEQDFLNAQNLRKHRQRIKKIAKINRKKKKN